ncbi:hypothetical protein K438DRAFT_1468956, partial [Mycena galopus ATCC 62051]
FGVEFNTLNPSRKIRMQLPLFHHCGEDPAKTQRNNSAACKCLRGAHLVLSVEEGWEVRKKLDNETHEPSKTCPCLSCSEERRVRACTNPHSCAKAVDKRFDSLLPKWDPRENLRDDDEEGDRVSGDDSTVFRAPKQIESLTEGFRIFTHTSEDDEEFIRPIRPPHRGQTQVTMWIHGATKRNNTGVVQAGAGVWFEAEDPRNRVIRLVGSLSQTASNAETVAALAGLQGIQPEVDVKIVS